MENDSKDDMQVLLKQPYFVTMARHDFNIHESRVFLKVMEVLQPRMIYDKSPIEVRKDDLGHLEISIQAKSLVKSGNYDDIKRALKQLTRKEIIIQERDEKGMVVSELFTNLLMAGEISYRASTCELLIHKKIVPHLIALDKNYTRFLYAPAFNSSSPNTMKLYMMCAHFRDKKQINVKLATLRNILRIEKKYGRAFDIKRWILDPAVQELKQRADVWFDIVETVKSGRKVVGWKFNIYTKNGKTEKLIEQESQAHSDKQYPTQQDETPQAKTPKLQGIQRLKGRLEAEQAKIDALKESLALEIYKQKLKEEYKLGYKQVEKLLAWSGSQAALQKELFAIKNYINRGKVQNIGAYTVKVLGEKLGIEL